MDQKELYAGLSQVTWPGRLEIVREKPTIILDGAHNVDGIRALTGFLTSQFPDRRRLLIFGVMKDKEYEKMLGELLPYVDETILTMPANDRALPPEFIKKFAPRATVSNDVTWALKKAKSMLTDEDIIVITGSLYLVGECKTIINEIF
jgi:dihydrofolate synthase/folylpolyglutamate synthase